MICAFILHKIQIYITHSKFIAQIKLWFSSIGKPSIPYNILKAESE